MMELKDKNIIKALMSCLVLVYICLILINITSAQPVDRYREENLSIYSINTPTFIELITPNMSLKNASIVSSSNNLYTFNIVLRNIGQHKVIYGDGLELKEEYFYVTHRNNPLSLRFSWLWSLLIGGLISLILMAFKFWKFAGLSLLITGIIIVLSEVGTLSLAIGIFLIIFGSRWIDA